MDSAALQQSLLMGAGAGAGLQYGAQVRTAQAAGGGGSTLSEGSRSA